ncbi:hypothetical protein CRG98_047822 [Punica granatum]|uniref:aspartate--tRNA ligase n=1 Tax=Punica granatum TaxID=22663 RepID=A0A2I0HJL5_PUNGR|nr:hypothetical protein CRG98_047822 [Punica granatum]
MDNDPLFANYGDIPLAELQSKSEVDFPYTEVGSLMEHLNDEVVLVRGRAQTIRGVGKKMAFVVVRERGFTVQAVVSEQAGLVSPQMVKYVASLNRESIIDVEGILTVPSDPIKGASQKSCPEPPHQPRHAARSEADIKKDQEYGDQLVRVNQDTRLNHRIIDIRTPANQGIFRIQSQVGNIFRQFLLSEGFAEIHMPKLIAGSSEGGSAVLELDYKGQPACLDQSPQLHKQMVTCGDFVRAFEIGPAFRAEDSYTHRHLCKFTSLDIEMEIKKHYSEARKGVLFFYVMDVVDRLFVERLKDAGVEIDPLGDLNTESERKLGQLVLEGIASENRYGTEFYILHRSPLAARPFYNTPCYDNPAYSSSFDVFIQGEEIISGAQHVHVPEFLIERVQSCGIDVNTISTYVDSFRYGAPPHGRFRVGLERVVMLFCGLDNIRKTLLYPRDLLRIAPSGADRNS